ncbi:transcriptional regulator [Actinomyces bowdenii]|uniref:Transcriptional regulator n=1 Tax=Actinomyces bowdenii TaxID=131109 RepID=A0A853EMV4_9ACTO|nr:transcriptional regulator [Actinomyces bowdenii]MBF0698082.1 transcriptional regulator [Actinomyces bowdenii]NYS70255.1 transcriptional regulator [Actinomyces bowdenii]
MALSQRDRQRVAQGLEPEDLARADYDSDALTTARGSERGAGVNDARLLAEVPPHWQ